MRVARSGGLHLASLEHRYRARARLVIAGASAAAVAVGIALSPITSLLVVPVGASLLAPIRRQLRRVRRGIKGEATVTAFLGELSDDYVLVNDVVLPGRRGHVDHVLVGPCGVLVIEAKHYRGIVSRRRNTWRANGRPTRDITRPVTQAAMAVTAFVGARHPDLRRSVGWADAVVVFSDPRCRLDLDRPTPTVARISELLGMIRSKPPRLRPEDARAIAASLARTADLDEATVSVPRRLPEAAVAP